MAAPVPTVTTTVPTSGATGVNVANALTATFSQPMNSATITASTLTLTGPGNTAVSGLVTYNTGTSTSTFTPNASLAYSTSYTATITTARKSSAGAALASNYSWTFTTGASPEPGDSRLRNDHTKRSADSAARRRGLDKCLQPLPRPCSAQPADSVSASCACASIPRARQPAAAPRAIRMKQANWD